MAVGDFQGLENPQANPECSRRPRRMAGDLRASRARTKETCQAGS